MGRKISFNQGWKFLKTSLNVDIKEIREKHTNFNNIEIPHDWLIYDSNNLYEDSIGWYKKTIKLSDIDCDLSNGERIILYFDGVYMDSTLYVNDREIGDWKYGYSAFSFDVTDELKDNDNEILMQVRYAHPNSRWYSGAGIYRNVWLYVMPSAHLPIDGTYVSIKPKHDADMKIEKELFYGSIYSSSLEFNMEIETEVVKHSDSISCYYSLWQGDKCVKELGMEDDFLINDNIGCSRKSVVISKPKLWDINTPNLYQLKVELVEKDTGLIIDTDTVSIGFRTMTFYPDKGFYLNGRKVIIQGVCEHHDFGCLGAVFNKFALRRKFEILQKMGVNAVRTSHNMPASELMDLADEMGILILSEAFDMWERPKSKYDYGCYFKEWAKKDVRSWVRRDRNHPSLMLWSIGNEIYDTCVDEYGQEITERLANYVKEYDPKGNALITLGSNHILSEDAQKCLDIVKIAGYNYGQKHYHEHHKKYDDWVIYGSETASIVQSRGVYHFPLKQPLLTDEDEQCSGLGNSVMSWGAKSTEACIINHRNMDFIFGQFIWTGFDYIGESTPYQTKNSYFGQIDTAGFPKDSYYIYQAEWTSAKTNPMVHLFPYWDFNDGQIIDLRACTNGDSVELFLNGKSLGRQYIDHKYGEKLVGEWQASYEKGEIRAVAYDKDGKVIAEDFHKSFGDTKRLKLEVNKNVLKSVDDCVFVTISAEDECGNPVENAMEYVTVSIKGAGRLLGMDNGDSTDYDSYKSSCRKLFNGKLLAVVAPKNESGEIFVEVKSKQVESAKVKLLSEVVSSDNIAYLENCCNDKSVSDVIPVRKIELFNNGCSVLTKENPTTIISATLFPKQATNTELVWKAVNDAGIEIHFVKLEGNGNDSVKVTAVGDGNFRVRCMSRNNTDKVKIISQLEFVAEGMGEAFRNPYQFISGGLFDERIGDTAYGNEQGISTFDDCTCGAVYHNIDFGDYGSDEIIVPISSMYDKCQLEIWLGKPDDGELIGDISFDKKAPFRTYQTEVWKLKRRIKGINTLSFIVRQRAFIKGFSFVEYDKSVSRIYAVEANSIYGDSFTEKNDKIENIGNNVVLRFENMDFQDGVNKINISGRTPLSNNLIKINFIREDGTLTQGSIDFSQTKEYINQIFDIEYFIGKGSLEFVFLPGSNFDFDYFQFSR